jgi:N-acetylmuramic acid 6-phosphate etherase
MPRARARAALAVSPRARRDRSGMMAPLLGIECGGTHTTVSLSIDPPEAALVLGPGNFRLTSPAEFATLFTAALGSVAGAPAAIGLAVAGARHAQQHDELEAMLRSAMAAMAGGWQAESAATLPIRVSHDLESALLASGPLPASGTRMVCIAGTGSVCCGRQGVALGGSEVRGGGWGHLLGDEGSGFMLGSGLLRLLTVEADRCRRSSRPPTALMAKVLTAAGLRDSWDDMIGWVADASKDQVAALAELCLEAASEPGADAACLALVQSEAEKLSQTAAETLEALRVEGQEVTSEEVLLYGGLFQHHTFRGAFTRALAVRAPDANPQLPPRPSVCGAIEMAATALAAGDDDDAPVPAAAAAAAAAAAPPAPASPKCWVPPLASLGARSPTELRNPLSTSLDTTATADAVALFLGEDAALPAKIAAHKETLAALVQATTAAFKAGGRLVYLGAGTSGRLGVLDASECPPTFGTDPSIVQGLIAGGPGALLKAVEGAEDSTSGGAADVSGCGACTLLGGAVTSRDVVVGIAASGRTPYVWGALAEAKRRGATTALLCFNPNIIEALALPDDGRGGGAAAASCEPDYVMAIDAGPELLTGSTRLKAGTATKLVLNILTTLSLGVGMGHVITNLMVNMRPTNEKLQDRAVRILTQLFDGQGQGGDSDGAKKSAEECRAALEACGWVIADARGALAQQR